MIEPRYTGIADWFTLDEVGDGIFRITETYYREDYRCNVYLIKGRNFDIVLDSGLGLASLKSFLKPISRDPILVQSHAHYDHIGSAFEFERRFIHPAEGEIIAHPTRANTYADLLLVTEDFAKLPWDGYNADEWQPEPAPCEPLIAHDILDLGGRKLEVLHTPGHSTGSICLWDASAGILFSADTVYGGELFDQLPCSHIPTYVETMRRLHRLPVVTAFPGHGAVLTAGAYRDVIESYLRTRSPERALAEE